MIRILIADDDRRITAALSARLQSAGFRTQIVHNGFDAFQIALHDPPDLMLMDIWMPGVGLAVAELLNDLKSPIPIILLSASGHQSLPEDARRVGARAFIQKPFSGAQLLLTISRTLAESAPPPHAPAADSSPPIR